MRQFGCIEISELDAMLLRDAVRPLAKVDPYEPATLIRFCEKLYDALLRLKAEAIDLINISLEEHEALFLNQFVGNEDWQGAAALLEQSWLVLYERRYQRPYPRSAAAAAYTGMGAQRAG